MGCEGMSSRCSSNATGQVTCTSKANWEQAKLGCPHPPVSSTVPKGYRKILVHFVKINSTNVIDHESPETSILVTPQKGPGTSLWQEKSQECALMVASGDLHSQAGAVVSGALYWDFGGMQ